MPNINITLLVETDMKTIIAVESTTWALQKYFKNKCLVNSHERKKDQNLSYALSLCLLQTAGKDFTILLLWELI